MPLPKNKESRLAMWKKNNYLFDIKRQRFLGQPGLSDSLEEFQGGYFNSIPSDGDDFPWFSTLAFKLRIPNDFHIFQGEELSPVVYTMISRFKKHLKKILNIRTIVPYATKTCSFWTEPR